MCGTVILKQNVATHRINIIMPHFKTIHFYIWVKLIINYYYYHFYIIIRFFEVVLTHWPFQDYCYCAVASIILWVAYWPLATLTVKLKKIMWWEVYKFPLAPMGVLAPGSEHARPSTQPPIDTSGNFSADVSAESPSNISPNPSEVISEVSEP